MGLLGIVVFVALGWALSRNRKAIHWPTIGWALGLQWLIALVVLRGGALAHGLGFLPWPRHGGWSVLALLAGALLLRRQPRPGPRRLAWALAGLAGLGALRGNLVEGAFEQARGLVQHLMGYAGEGATFIFGPLADPMGAPVRGTAGSLGMVFAFVVLPTIIFMASLFAVLYHLGVMPRVVDLLARIFRRFLRLSGAESLSVAASIFLGQTEAPLTIRPFLARLTRSELMLVMTAGMAHVSGAIMVAYVQVARVDIVHLLTAVLMTAPGAVLMAKLLEPETEQPETASHTRPESASNDANLLDAAVRGASEGMQLAINVAAMLIAIIALVALVNGCLRAIHPGLTLEWLLSLVFRPFALLMGVPWPDSGAVAALLGKRTVVNEFVAYIGLGQDPVLGVKARLIATFALCGFANFSSIAIQVGGIGALVPERRHDLARLGLRAMLAGTLANFLSACIAGLLV
jgi:CNT family concentrative nucleoside transporter